MFSERKMLNYRTHAPEKSWKKLLSSIGLKAVDFGLHSLRSGGATAAYSCGVSDRLFKIHGRWKSEQAKDGYVLEDIQKRLSV